MISARHLLAAALCLAWIVPGLTGHDPWKPDEAYTFGVVYEILSSGSWIVPRIAGEPFLSDPPFYHLTAALSAQLFAPLLPLHDGARIVTGFYMALTFLFCGLAGRELNGEGCGVTAALLLLGSFGLAVRSHQLIPDAAALTGFTMAYYGFALALRRPHAGGFWAGTGAGMIFMTQGLLETAAIAVIAALLPLFPAWRTRRYAAGLVTAGMAAAPWLFVWPALLYFESPELFNHWLWDENLARLLAGGWRTALSYYFGILPWYAWPVWPIALWSLWAARNSGVLRPHIVLPLAGFVVTLGLISAAPEARELYALPLLPALALLANPGVETLRRGAANAWYWFSVMGFTFFVIVAWVYWSGLELGIPARLHAHLSRLQPGYVSGFKLAPFLLGIAYSSMWFAVLAGLKRSPERPVFVWAAGITTIWALLAILFVGWIDAAKSYRTVAASLREALPRQYDCISSRNLGESQRAMLHYHAGIITYREEAAERQRECRLLLVQGHPQKEIAPSGPWRKIWEGGRPRDKEERFRLYQRP
jgi:4-amino-4-deoxy-L-arabinose transferase-like glycosyltransferase